MHNFVKNIFIIEIGVTSSVIVHCNCCLYEWFGVWNEVLIESLFWSEFLLNHFWPRQSVSLKLTSKAAADLDRGCCLKSLYMILYTIINAYFLYKNQCQLKVAQSAQHQLKVAQNGQNKRKLPNNLDYLEKMQSKHLQSGPNVNKSPNLVALPFRDVLYGQCDQKKIAKYP